MLVCTSRPKFRSRQCTGSHVTSAHTSSPPFQSSCGTSVTCQQHIRVPARCMQVYADVIDTLPRSQARVPTKRRSQLTTDPSATFQLIENDFTVAGRKVAGNAQCITKGRWLQHTSFLWDFSKDRMALLQEPARRPQYRGNRKHGTFLTPMISLGMERGAFVEGIQDAVEARGFDVQPTGKLWTCTALHSAYAVTLVQVACAARASLRCCHYAFHAFKFTCSHCGATSSSHSSHCAPLASTCTWPCADSAHCPCP